MLGVAVADLYDTLVGLRMPVPWTTAITVVAIDLGLLGWTLVFRNRLKREGIHLNPFVAMRTAALAVAASRAGALVAGFFAGVGFWYALDLSVSIARERLIICAVSAVAGVVLALIAIWLERICRLPKDPDDAEGLPSRMNPARIGSIRAIQPATHAFVSPLGSRGYEFRRGCTRTFPTLNCVIGPSRWPRRHDCRFFYDLYAHSPAMQAVSSEGGSLGEIGGSIIEVVKGAEETFGEDSVGDMQPLFVARFATYLRDHPKDAAAAKAELS